MAAEESYPLLKVDYLMKNPTTGSSEFYRLLVLELPASPFRRTEPELISVQIKLEMRFIDNGHFGNFFSTGKRQGQSRFMG